jgi:hypothetical protein
MELEEERKLRMTLEHHLTEQQKRIEGLDNTSISADQFTDSTQVYLMEKKHRNKYFNLVISHFPRPRAVREAYGTGYALFFL